MLDVLPSEESVPNPAGQLVAVGVLDVLPSLSSSVYFFWDPEIAPLSPGRSCTLAGTSLNLRLCLLAWPAPKGSHVSGCCGASARSTWLLCTSFPSQLTHTAH